MTSIYDQFRKDDKEQNVLELAPSQNIKEDKTPAFNQYDEFRKQDREAVKNQVKANLQLVMDKDPDMVGEGLKLAEELNLPKEFALNSNEAVSLMMEKNRKDKLKRLETAQYSPVLYKQLTDPTFAALAYDNIDNLEAVSYTHLTLPTILLV